MTTPAFHLDLAREAFGAGNLPRTLRHFGEGLALDPLDGPTLQAVYYVLPQVPDVLALTAMDEGSAPRDVAVRALALALAHQWTEALEVLFGLAAQDPKTPYLAWAEPWLAEHPSASLVDFGVLGPTLVRFGDTFEQPIGADDPAWRTLSAGTTIVAKLADTFVDKASLRALQGKLLRRGKRYDEALALAHATREREPRLGALLAGWAYRDLERPEEAIAALREAYELDEDDDLLVDIGDLQLESGQLEAALATFQRVDPNGSSMPAAYAGFVAANLLISRDRIHALELWRLWGQGNARAKELFDVLHAYAEVWPVPVDLTAGVVTDVQAAFAAQPGQGKPDAPLVLTVGLTSVESPSVTLALAVAAEMHGCFVRLDVMPERVASPDPRLPLGEALGVSDDDLDRRFPLWRYAEAGPVRVPSPPPGDIVKELVRLAGSPFDWPTLQAAAAQVGPSFAGRLPALLAALVYPPTPAKPEDAVAWVTRYQLAGALVVASLDSGWAGSERRTGLLSLAHGPVDWILRAVVPVLGLVFAEQPDARPEIWSLFDALRRRVPDLGYCCYRAPLEATLMRLPRLDEPLRREAFARLVSATRRPYRG